LRPDLKLLTDGYCKILGDNVDSVYYFTQLRGDQEYRIWGKRYDSCYLSFSVYGGQPDGEIVERVSNNINHRQIEFEPDGSFEIILTPEPKGKNQFKLDSDAVNMFTREYFFDRFNSRESELHIENLKPVEKARPLDDFLPPFPFEADQGGWGTVDNTYCFGRYRLEENEYMKIRFTSPECCYWGIQTWNFLMQSMDFKNYKVCINKSEAKPNDDGSYTVYLSHKPMNVDNWISTGGYKEAVIFCRWLLAEEMPAQPAVEIGRLDDLAIFDLSGNDELTTRNPFPILQNRDEIDSGRQSRDIHLPAPIPALIAPTLALPQTGEGGGPAENIVNY
jgi:hypothetical protein